MTRRGGWGPSGEAQRAQGAEAQPGEAEERGERAPGGTRGVVEGAPGEGRGAWGGDRKGAGEGEGCGGPDGARAAGVAELRQRGASPERRGCGASRWVSAAGLGTRLRAPLPRLGLWLRGSRAAGKSNLPEAAASRHPGRAARRVRERRRGRPQGPGRGRGRGLRASVSVSLRACESLCVWRAWRRGSRCWEPGE